MHHQTLPIELFYNIIHHLDDATLHKARQTNNRFRKYVDTHVPVLLVTISSSSSIIRLLRILDKWNGTRRAVIVFSKSSASNSLYSIQDASCFLYRRLHVIDIYQSLDKVKTDCNIIVRSKITYPSHHRQFIGFGPEADVSSNVRNVNGRKCEPIIKVDQTRSEIRLSQTIQNFIRQGDIIVVDGQMKLVGKNNKWLHVKNPTYEFNAEIANFLYWKTRFSKTYAVEMDGTMVPLEPRIRRLDRNFMYL